MFQPDQVFLGDTTGSAWEINAGAVQVDDGSLVIQVGPIPGHDAVYDYVELVGTDGVRHRFEAEDTTVTQGDVFAGQVEGDGHWWLQTHALFSNQQGLVGSKRESLPVLTTTAAVPNGDYTVLVGSFTGDPGNGAFGLGVTLK